MVKKVWTITGEVPSCCARRYRLPAANYTAEKAPIYRLASSCAHDNRPRFRIRFLHPAVPSETGHLAPLPHPPSVSAISSAANQCGERPGCISQSNDQHIALPNGRIAVGAVRGVCRTRIRIVGIVSANTGEPVNWRFLGRVIGCRQLTSSGVGTLRIARPGGGSSGLSTSLAHFDPRMALRATTY